VDKLVNVIVTVPDLDWVTSFTRGLIEDGLATCGNIVPSVRSIYAWKGAIRDENLALVLLHTRQSLVPKVMDRAANEHRRDMPQILVQHAVHAHPRYHAWVTDGTADLT